MVVAVRCCGGVGGARRGVVVIKTVVVSEVECVPLLQRLSLGSLMSSSVSSASLNKLQQTHEYLGSTRDGTQVKIDDH